MSMVVVPITPRICSRFPKMIDLSTSCDLSTAIGDSVPDTPLVLK
jgi:hypothetical protein